MRIRLKPFAVPIVLVALLALVPLIAAAANYNDIPMNHYNPYDGTNNWGTSSQGVWKVYTPDGLRYKGHTGNVYWSLNSITWIRNSTQGNRYQPAMVVHAFKGGGGEHCDGGYYESYWSDLPGNWSQVKPSAVGCDNNELRVGAGLPWNMNAYQVYYTEGTWVNTSGGSGELTFDNYWLDTQPPPWNPYGSIIRDFQAKLCFSDINIDQPSGVCP